MIYSDLLRAWITLIGLSAVSTVVSIWSVPVEWQAAVGAALLGVAWLKARVILARYLGLAASPFWARGFGFGLSLLSIILLGLYLVPFMS